MDGFERDQSVGGESLTMMLISEIAEQEGVDPAQLTPPISTIIDTDALATFFLCNNNGAVKVEFTYSGHQIRMEGKETLHIEVE